MTKKQIKEITDLPGIGGTTAEKLKEAGFTDLMSIAVASPGQLIGASNIPQALATKIINAARNSLKMAFVDASEILEKRKSVVRLNTGSKLFNQLLGGGMESGAITEAYASYGSGKTQLAHQLSVVVQLTKEKGGMGGKAVFIDTENTFRPERIIQIAKRYNIKQEIALKNIIVARAYNSDHQMLLTEKIGELIKKGENIKLIVVDSLTAHFRAEFIGRGTLAERQQKLNKHMHTLTRLADLNNAVVYVTNQVMARPDMFFGDPTEAIGGHIVAHNSIFRIYLRRGKKNTRVAKLVDSPNLPEAEIPFKIVEEGIVDV